jgi:hypothetical protein
VRRPPAAARPWSAAPAFADGWARTASPVSTSRARRSCDADCQAVCLLLVRDATHEQPSRPGPAAPPRRHGRVARGPRRSSASTSGPRPPPSTPTSARSWPRTCARSRTPAAPPACSVPLVMQVLGGLATLDEAAGHAAFALLSGLRGGRRSRRPDRRARRVRERALFDMGGRRRIVRAILGGEAKREHARRRWLPVRLPTPGRTHGRRRRRVGRVADVAARARRARCRSGPGLPATGAEASARR